MAIFEGAGVAIVTPFKSDESIDYDRLDELIDFHCENGTDSIIICGTTGESATMVSGEPDGGRASGVREVYDRADEGKDSGHCRDRFELYQDSDRDVQGGGGIWSGRTAACYSVL